MLAPPPAAPPSDQLARARGLRRQAAALLESSMSRSPRPARAPLRSWGCGVLPARAGAAIASSCADRRTPHEGQRSWPEKDLSPANRLAGGRSQRDPSGGLEREPERRRHGRGGLRWTEPGRRRSNGDVFFDNSAIMLPRTPACR